MTAHARLVSAHIRNAACPRGHRWILGKREGAQVGLGEYYLFARAA